MRILVGAAILLVAGAPATIQGQDSPLVSQGRADGDQPPPPPRRPFQQPRPQAGFGSFLSSERYIL